MAKESKIDAMRKRGDVTGLERLMNHPLDWLDGLDAAEALALLGEESGVDYLLECLRDPDAEVRDVAIEILEHLDQPRATQALRDLAQNSMYPIVDEDRTVSLECGNCGNTIPSNAKVCPHCGIQLYGDKIQPTSIKGSHMTKSKPAIQSATHSGERFATSLNSVVIVDFDLPFTSMVRLLVKIALASIPAIIILSLIFGFLFILFGSVFIGLINQLF
jgi:hypothetical protein